MPQDIRSVSWWLIIKATLIGLEAQSVILPE
jgi:hypothetical protein